jgi:hypothetical protein
MVYLAFMSGPNFPEGASLAPVRLFPPVVISNWDCADAVAPIQAIDFERKYTPIQGRKVSAEPT